MAKSTSRNRLSMKVDHLSKILGIKVDVQVWSPGDSKGTRYEISGACIPTQLFYGQKAFEKALDLAISTAECKGR